MRLLEALAAPRKAELLRSVKKSLSPSQALGGLWIGDTGTTTVPQTDLDPTKAVKNGFKANVFVYACVTRLAAAASSLVWRVERKNSDGEWEPDENDWRAMKLAYPNQKMSSKELFYYAFAWLCLNGNALFRRVEGGPNGLLELWPMSPVNVQVVPDRVEWISGYNIVENGRTVRNFPAEQVIHARLPDPLNPLWGVGPLQSAWGAVQSDVASNLWRQKLYESGGVPPGAITDNALVTTEQIDAAHAQLKLAWKRGGKEFVPMVLGSGSSYLNFGFSAADMMIPDDRAANIAEIATAFGMLPAMFDVSASTYDNIRTAVRFMYDNGVLPLADVIRDALNLALLTEQERESDSVYITYDLTGVPFFRAEREAKIEQLGKALKSGISRSDAVELLDLGLDSVEGDEAVFIEPGLVLLSEAAVGTSSDAASAATSMPFGQPPPTPAQDAFGLAGYDSEGTAATSARSE